ncbi:MAG: hypothetical protein ABWZ02_05760, partial [Nakamurella sp.]
MSPDLTPPRPGDLPAPAPRYNTDEAARAQNAPQSYSAPAPADRATSMPTAQSAAPGNPPAAGRAWSEDMARDTGPVPTPAGDQAWQSRPSGAWATPTWGAAGNPGSGPGNTQSFPSGPQTGGYYPASGYGSTGYRSAGLGPATATRNPPPAATTKRSRTSLIVATTAAVALLAGFGGGLVGAELNSGSSTASDSSLTKLNTSAAVADRTAAPAGSVQEVAAKVLPSTVSVLASSQQSGGEGSGVILSADGLILTNNHVVAGATTL